MLELRNKGMYASKFIQYAIPFLNANPSITTLDISGNYIGDEGAQALALHNSTVRALYVGDNRIGNVGGLALARKTT